MRVGEPIDSVHIAPYVSYSIVIQMHFAVRPALSADSTKIVLVAIDPISLMAVYAMVFCDDIRHVFGVRGASNELLRERASVREANREGLSDIANNLFQVGRYTLNQGSHVIDIRREDLIATKDQFAWDKSDIPAVSDRMEAK